MKLLVVDAHPTMRVGLATLLHQVDAEALIFEAGSGDEALAMAAAHADLHVALVDLAMPDMDGLQLLQRLALDRPHLPLLALSISEDPHHVRAALALGARGYLPKSASPATILSAFKLVLSGDVYVPPFVLDGLNTNPQTGMADIKEMAKSGLTHRQLEVLHFIRDGMSNKEICRQLGLAEKTVKSHVTSIIKSLHASNRVHAVSIARQNGLIEKENSLPRDA
jgi:DNA-binding NarL/FixJ family response regulator